MSATLSLTRDYGSFFWECTKFAVSPYANTFMTIANDKSNEDSLHKYLAATLITSGLTFVLPVLPILTTVTFAMALVAMSMAVVTAIIAYPAAVLIDTFIEPNTGRDMSFV